MVKHQEGYLGCRVPLGGLRGFNPILGSPAQAPSVGKTSGDTIYLDEMKILLKVPCTDSLAGTHPGIQHGDSGSTKVIQRKTELCCIRVKAGGKAAIVSLLSSPLVQPTGGHHLSCTEPAS